MRFHQHVSSRHQIVPAAQMAEFMAQDGVDLAAGELARQMPSGNRMTGRQMPTRPGSSSSGVDRTGTGSIKRQDPVAARDGRRQPEPAHQPDGGQRTAPSSQIAASKLSQAR